MVSVSSPGILTWLLYCVWGMSVLGLWQPNGMLWRLPPLILGKPWFVGGRISWYFIVWYAGLGGSHAGLVLQVCRMIQFGPHYVEQHECCKYTIIN